MFEATNGEALTIPATGSAVRRSCESWSEGDTQGFPIVPLLEDAQVGLKTWLMRIEAGASAPLHSHDEIEQIYLLEGQFSDGEEEYGPGDFIVRAPGAPHLTASDGGALMLLFYSPASGANS